MNGFEHWLSGPLLLPLAALVGLVVGSFLNVVVHRLPIMLDRAWAAAAVAVAGEASGRDRFNLLYPPSTCPACGRGIRSWENVPVLSYIALGGRCGGCRAPISPRYPAVEILGALAALVMAWRFGPTLAGVAGAGFAWVLIAAAAIDLDHYVLPDALVLPLLWAGLIVNVGAAFVPLQAAVIGAVAGYLVLWAPMSAFEALTGKEAMGAGDFKLLAALGAWCGWRMLPLIVVVAALAGVIVGGLWLAASRKGREQPIPFGPFLAAAGVLALLEGPAIVNAYIAWTRCW